MSNVLCSKQIGISPNEVINLVNSQPLQMSNVLGSNEIEISPTEFEKNCKQSILTNE